MVTCNAVRVMVCYRVGKGKDMVMCDKFSFMFYYCLVREVVYCNVCYSYH